MLSLNFYWILSNEVTLAVQACCMDNRITCNVRMYVHTCHEISFSLEIGLSGSHIVCNIIDNVDKDPRWSLCTSIDQILLDILDAIKKQIFSSCLRQARCYRLKRSRRFRALINDHTNCIHAGKLFASRKQHSLPRRITSCQEFDIVDA